MKLNYFLKNKGKEKNDMENHLEEEKWYSYLIDNKKDVNVKYGNVIRLDNGSRVSITFNIIDVKIKNLGPIFNEFDLKDDVYIVESKIKYYFNNEEFLETSISYGADNINSYEEWITFCKENISYEVRSSLNEKLNNISKDEFNINKLLNEIKSEREKTLILNSDKEKEIIEDLSNRLNKYVIPIINKKITYNLEDNDSKLYEQASDKFKFKIYNHNDLDSNIKKCNKLLNVYFNLTGNRSIKINTDFNSFKEMKVFQTSNSEEQLYLGFKINGKSLFISIYESGIEEKSNIVLIHNINELLSIK